jgi:hypothetical protein
MTNMQVDDVYLDEWMRKWITSTARREHWRISWYSLEDLIQDGYLCYAKCKRAYLKHRYRPDQPNPLLRDMELSMHPTKDAKNTFMNLVQRTFMNHIYTLSKKHPVGMEVPDADPWGSCRVEPEQAEESSLFTLLTHAPAELQDLLDRLLRDGIEGGGHLRKWYYDKTGRWRAMRHGHVIETKMEHWERVLGNADKVAELMSYLKPDVSYPVRKTGSFNRLAAVSRQYESQKRERFRKLAGASRRYQTNVAKHKENV